MGKRMRVDYELIDELVSKVGHSGMCGMDKLLFLYREAKGLTVEETVEVYYQIYQDMISGKAPYYPILGEHGHVGFASEGWICDRKKLLRDLRVEGNIRKGLEFMLSRKFSYFITRLHRIMRRRWKEGKTLGYVLIEKKRDEDVFMRNAQPRG